LALLDLVPHQAAISPFAAVGTILHGKRITIGAKVVAHSRYVIFPLAEVAVPRLLLAALLGRIDRIPLAMAVWLYGPPSGVEGAPKRSREG
jgi:hypothetical protein